MKSKLFGFLMGACLLLAVSCEKEPEAVKVTGISVSPTSLSLVEGESGDITATVSPSNADDKTVIWDSSDNSVATVSNGKVTAVKAGSATVTAKSADGGFTASCAVTVAAKVIDVSSVSLSKTELTLTEGDSETITATVKPDDATDKTVTWSTSDAAVATVDGGKITAVKEGTATITAKAGDKTATCAVTVNKKIIYVESVELDKTALELTEGDSETLVATVKPDDATDKTVTWSSSDDAVATVDGGKITAVKPGTATITATSGEKSASCQVKVNKKIIPVESVKLDKTELELTEGDSETLVATVKPDDATDKTVTWSSSDDAVATVEGGKITAVKPGTATITATAGEKSATCKVTVNKRIIAVESVELNKTEIDLVEGDSETLVATVKPDDATDKTVTWTSSDPAVATVDGGKVTAVKEGTATITAKAGEKTATCTVYVDKKIIAVESVELDKTELQLKEGDSETLVATVKPDDATDKTVTWTSSDPAVATVEGGKVTAVKAGVATITAKAGEKTATCAVTVEAKVHPLASLLGDYEFWALFFADDDELYYYYWDMTITPDEDNESRIWIDKMTIFQSDDFYGKYFLGGDVYADVSEDMKKITIPVPQLTKATAWAFEDDENFALYKSGEYGDPITKDGVITFRLQNDGSWVTEDSYGFYTPSVAKEGMLYWYYLNCFSELLPDECPTMFVKKTDSAPKAASPSRSTKRTFALPKKIDVRPPFLPEKASHKLNK